MRRVGDTPLPVGIEPEGIGLWNVYGFQASDLRVYNGSMSNILDITVNAGQLVKS